jgi:CO/xanthine dehydrogenase FAD-binding subunit
LKNFEYYYPNSLTEACALLEGKGEGARALAGGQSLIPIMKLGLSDVTCVVDLKRIPDLSYIRKEGSELVIGALATHSEVAHSELLRSILPLISETARKIGHVQIRNRGTIGGSLCHADPSADLPPTMLTLNATLVVQNKDGRARTIRASDFFRGVFSTALEKGEILREVRIQIPPSGSKYSFQKLTMPTGGFALVLASTMLHIEASVCKSARVSIGGVTEKPFRATMTESALTDKKLSDLDERAILSAAHMATQDVKLMEGLEYPKELVVRLTTAATRRSIADALGSEMH